MNDVPAGRRRGSLFRAEALGFFERMDSYAIPFAVRRPRRLWLVVALVCLLGALLLFVMWPARNARTEHGEEAPAVAATLRSPPP